MLIASRGAAVEERQAERDSLMGARVMVLVSGAAEV